MLEEAEWGGSRETSSGVRERERAQRPKLAAPRYMYLAGEVMERVGVTWAQPS
jgi:hypothetical protein